MMLTKKTKKLSENIIMGTFLKLPLKSCQVDATVENNIQINVNKNKKLSEMSELNKVI